eukprot:403358174
MSKRTMSFNARYEDDNDCENEELKQAIRKSKSKTLQKGDIPQQFIFQPGSNCQFINDKVNVESGGSFQQISNNVSKGKKKSQQVARPAGYAAMQGNKFINGLLCRLGKLLQKNNVEFSPNFFRDSQYEKLTSDLRLLIGEDILLSIEHTSKMFEGDVDILDDEEEESKSAPKQKKGKNVDTDTTPKEMIKSSITNDRQDQPKPITGQQKKQHLNKNLPYTEEEELKLLRGETTPNALNNGKTNLMDQNAMKNARANTLNQNDQRNVLASTSDQNAQSNVTTNTLDQNPNQMSSAGLQNPSPRRSQLPVSRFQIAKGPKKTNNQSKARTYTEFSGESDHSKENDPHQGNNMEKRFKNNSKDL